ncbi:MAG: acyl-CoA dehydratase activase [Oscillospiraceae bacterium]|jgi:predicted CoA-substrate-specific enzyme activase|nr:acyl-CoA dehydratase activase [Oscillospiraceae bacterium]
MRIGLDIGSTTLKCVVLNDADEVIFKEYKRHFSKITEMTAELLVLVATQFPEENFTLAISGSAGMGLAESLRIPFVQEVYATRLSIKKLLPQTDVVIELGGEDAKILFLSEQSGSGLEVRMNGSCAGGTGAFIDQMASLLNIEPIEMNALAKDYHKLYTIASRCGVFAKSDIQPLINQGANKSDIAASIFDAVVNQTIGGLAQGHPIEGNVVYLGGPLSFFSELRARFDCHLNTKGVCPENSLFFVAVGAAFAPSDGTVKLETIIPKIASYQSSGGYAACERLFRNEAEYETFLKRHEQNKVTVAENAAPKALYIGIDSGSTTVKAVAMDENEAIVYSEYAGNNGNPVKAVKGFLERLYEKFPAVPVLACAATGYGEDMIKAAFGADFGVVETIAHFTAAKKFNPAVDFIIDIGGQDIKCFQVHNGSIDNVFLNEACSSGCGSFLQTFAAAWGYDVAEFSKIALLADRPVDLGSRCTVFMNSSVKQAQKDGASVQNISAGLSVSVVKNALYKVIRAVNADSLGEHIVVQGGTFLNDAVLRAFEKEIGREVVRPSIAGLMGAYGAALYAKQKGASSSTLLNADELKEFRHKAKSATCKGCENHCRLTVNTFSGGRRFIGGNRCETPLAKQTGNKEYNLWNYKRELLQTYQPTPGAKRGALGLPLALNLYEMLPFWHTFFTCLGFSVVTSPMSDRNLFLKGQQTIPSDTVCYPAKLVHGHIETLIDRGVDAIFYPCMSYNFDEGLSQNHFNCPVVAYYPEVVAANMGRTKDIKFIYDYVSPDKRRFFPAKMQKILERHLGSFALKEVKKAAEQAYEEYALHMEQIRRKGRELMDAAEREGLPVIVLCGRPYHLDSEINHGIDALVSSFGTVVLSEEAVSHLVRPFKVNVLNQWTYHARLYAAANYVAQKENYNLVQLVSFGCGVDAITTDEIRSILEASGKIYTQLKIDEITNLGAVKIRLRSLFAVL